MEQSSQRRRLSVDKLRWTCDPKSLPLDSSSEKKPSLEIIGQERALDSLRMGLSIRRQGYHIFVTGTEGTGRTTTIRRVLEEPNGHIPDLEDICYVFNFEDADSPKLLHFPAGQGRDFQRRMAHMIASLRRHVPYLYRSESYQKRLSRLERSFRQMQEKNARDFSEHARQNGFALVEMQTGSYSRPELVVIAEDEELEITELGALVQSGTLSEDDHLVLVQNYEKLSDELKSVMRSNSRLEEELRREMGRLQQSVVLPLIRDGIEILQSRFDTTEVREWLEQVEEGLLEEEWIPSEDEETPAEPFFRYTVNLLIDNARKDKAPVIIESSPTFQNLFGNIERKTLPGGFAFYDYRQIKAGSLARAQGGTLVIMARDLLDEQAVWPMLKRVLRNEKLEIMAFDPRNQAPVGGLKPEPIDLDVKVILVGDSELYNMLLHGDPDLQRVFRIKADFETDMPRTRGNLRRYVSFLRKVQRKDGLLPLTPGANAAIVEYGARLASRRGRLSTRFSKLVEILIESDYFARKMRAASVGVEHIDRTLKERSRRLGAAEQHLHNAFIEGSILLDTRGVAVGQVNGLFVLEQWDYHFGQPMRMTAAVSPGEGDLVSIEREAELSGSSFDKGHLILEGFLRHRFAGQRPLCLDASISCEQNYANVDGDSATVTEAFSLLSALSGVPVKQSIAVTGSLNQFGQVQAIGGVNEKIEGFFKVCRDRGLSGEQGVIIPASNADRLMLSKEVVEAARKGEFHVWSIRTVDEGMEILTGFPAGRQRKNGSWTPGSVNDLVDRRLEEMREIQKASK
ncbi:MAG: AAA family ATPase [Candidatus Krumholzibacteria bacterium]|jgi:lon-related putative ATP-dependent protease|nr:AAA family ATPase [Candidatus Krumholzibacteria bacterium]MDP6797112.1 AAA family ATPase [Candidatus Krumholzibacteria bacterium]MDP7022435.1 AAA family ATPase [Candidatus Krumholzibacteria bacterium]